MGCTVLKLLEGTVVCHCSSHRGLVQNSSGNSMYAHQLIECRDRFQVAKESLSGKQVCVVTIAMQLSLNLDHIW